MHFSADESDRKFPLDMDVDRGHDGRASEIGAKVLTCLVVME